MTTQLITCLFGILVTLPCVWASALARLSFSADGDVAVQLTCGSRRLDVWMCLSGGTDVMEIWSAGVRAQLEQDVAGQVTCTLGTSHLILPWVNKGTKSYEFCVGTLPLGRHSELWLYASAIYVHDSKLELISGSRALALDAKFAIDQSWYYSNALGASGNASTAEALLCALPQNVELLTAAETTLTTDAWYCSKTAGALRIAALAPNNASGTWLVRTGTQWWTLVQPDSTNVLGTSALRRCALFLRGTQSVALKCADELQLVGHVWAGAIMAIVVAGFYLYPLRPSDALVIVVGTIGSIVCLGAERLAICPDTIYTLPIVILIIICALVAIVAMGVDVKHAMAGGLASLALHACFSNIPEYCGSEIAIGTELMRCTAISLCLLFRPGVSWGFAVRVGIIVAQSAVAMVFVAQSLWGSPALNAVAAMLMVLGTILLGGLLGAQCQKVIQRRYSQRKK